MTKRDRILISLQLVVLIGNIIAAGFSFRAMISAQNAQNMSNTALNNAQAALDSANAARTPGDMASGYCVDASNGAHYSLVYDKVSNSLYPDNSLFLHLQAATTQNPFNCSLVAHVQGTLTYGNDPKVVVRMGTIVFRQFDGSQPANLLWEADKPQ